MKIHPAVTCGLAHRHDQGRSYTAANPEHRNLGTFTRLRIGGIRTNWFHYTKQNGITMFENVFLRQIFGQHTR